MRICSIGECMIELSNESENKYNMGYAGDTANTAIYLSRLGAYSSYITSVGNDNFSKKMINFFNKENVTTENIHTNANASLGLYIIHNAKNGDRKFYYWRKNAAAKTLFENISIENLIKKIRNYDAIYFSGITLSIYDLKNTTLFYKFLKLLKNRGIKIYFDFNVRLNNWVKKERALKKIIKFSKISNIIFLTNEDLLNLKITNFKKFIIENFKKKLVVFRSGKGNIIIYNKEKFSYFNFVFKKNVKDTTGCGDAFNACFLFNYYKNLEIKYCLQMAHKLGKDVANVKGAIIKKESFNLRNYAKLFNR